MGDTSASELDRPGTLPPASPVPLAHPPQVSNVRVQRTEQSKSTQDSQPTERIHSQGEARILHPSGSASLAVPTTRDDDHRPVIRHTSEPTFHSPLRQHRRHVSSTRRIKETLNARSEHESSGEDGTVQHRINQYIIEQEIGRGSFGSVHYAIDQFGNEYAVKEFSKSRLRRRKQSNLLRRPRGPHARRGFNLPFGHSQKGDPNSLDLIREEIAIMKKLNHHNLVSLVEVLDAPEEDSLYMVMEMCKKGVVMQVGLDEVADPYDSETCRCWFRDMILGIEYLHAQGVIHRDIKPDNCLIDKDDVLKIVDFGVSEMFEKDREMKTSKSAGSPAFMPPELCVPKHGEVSGQAADIWSMGITLYCLRYGKIPFEKGGVLELYDAIRDDQVELGDDCDKDFRNMMNWILDKDPAKRITMDELREHPWVTKRGVDPLLPKEENIATMIEDPTEEEWNAAITGNMTHLLTVMKAAKHFKKLLFRKRPELMEGIFGRASHIVQPPLSIGATDRRRKSKSMDVDDRVAVAAALATEGVHRDIIISDDLKRMPNEADRIAAVTRLEEERHKESAKPLLGSEDARTSVPPEGSSSITATSRETSRQTSKSRDQDEALYPPRQERPHGKGHAHDLLEDLLFLNIGPGLHYTEPTPGLDQPMSNAPISSSPSSTSLPSTIPHVRSSHIRILSDSPPSTDFNIYEDAYHKEVTRILQDRRDRQPRLYLTRRVEASKRLREDRELAKTFVSEVAEKSKSLLSEALGRRKGAGGDAGNGGDGMAEAVEQVKRKAREDVQAGVADGRDGVVKAEQSGDSIMEDVQP
ncbi:kinase-like protein [Eremomyces bilateralis CBS 781.70]|uniref:Kinase-like protein n=1 Tax=Eremomyces bilateralis CBS 781.70 TaxID=1392243 RepID=A0A6G1G230_9PEZI|nr:kinase-like protein [Eremomyces bilateralis CBS 781.70]KAF1812042.1 kinase-like protein [Eremomyces bilateralis CBS 781.70]